MSNRNKLVKLQIIGLAGTRCMYCGKNVGSRITWHHLKPRYAGGQNTVENASLLCEHCHSLIHKHEWGSAEYREMTEIILTYRDIYTGCEWNFSFD